MATCPKCGDTFADTVQTCPKDGSSLLDDAYTVVEKELPAGVVVGGYRIERVIGDGGFGTVYRATHSVIGKSAAIKVLKREFSANPEMVSRFVAEARSVNQIRHRNIIDIFSFGTLEDGRCFYVMELLEGTTLDRLIQQRGGLTPEDALPILKQLARALSAAHAAGITHRDLKPENVFLTYDDEGQPVPKLLDFGIAKLKATSGSLHKTRSGTPMGTPLYMSPEQVHGKPIDHRTDIYSFGILVHELLTGAPPFDGDSVVDVMTKQAREPAPPISRLRPAYTTALDQPVLAMLEKDPERRPQSVTLAMEQLLGGFARISLVPAPSDPGVGRTQPVPSQTPRIQSSRDLQNRTVAFEELSPRNLSRTLRDADDGGASRTRWLVGAGMVSLAALLTAGYVVLNAGASSLAPGQATAAPPASTQAETAQPAATADVTATAAPRPVAAPVASEQVRVAFKSPAGAEVLRDGEVIGTTDVPLVVPRSDGRVKLTLRKSGFVTRDIWIEPARDLEVKEDLPRAGAGARVDSGRSDSGRSDKVKPPTPEAPKEDRPTRNDLQFE